jgi:non-ribosomal peptide synthetase component F
MDYDSSLPAQFQHIAACYPERVAIGNGVWQPTYAQLDAASSSLAVTLRGRCAHGGRIAILQRLDGFLICSLLGVLKAGQTAAVFNASEPIARLRQSLLDIEPAMVVSDSSTFELASHVTPKGVPVIDATAVSQATPVLERIDDGANEPTADLAFLIQTSGSTGRPKWVMQTHRNIAHNVRRHNMEMRIQPEDRILLLASPSGSQALATMFCTLLSGAALCPFPVAERGIIGLAEWIRQQQVTVYISAASAFRHFLKTLTPGDSFPRIRLVKVGAEAILTADISAAEKYFAPNCVSYCSYSSAEAGNMMQLRLSRGVRLSGSHLPLGKPAQGIEMLLCDESGQPLRGPGTGEIMVRSRYLSPGYWRNEKLTAERFTTAAGHDAVRTFRTGDLGRRELDGSLYCLGRRDDVVKIRGHGVELAEVQAGLASLPGIEESAVYARTSLGGAPSLAAFVVARAGTVIASASVKAALAAMLPDYMVPAEIVFLDRLPLNPHGKIDRGALLDRAASAAHADRSAPLAPGDLLTPAEVQLADIWQDVFGVEAGRVGAIGAHTNFFDLGGDSLTAAVVAARMRAAAASEGHSVNLDMLDFVEHPRLRELAARIEARMQAGPDDQAAQGLPAIERAERRTRYPLSFAQESIWKYSQTPAVNRGYTVVRSYGLRGFLDVEALREAMNCVARRNEILRTTFALIDGNPTQVVHPHQPVELPMVDLSGHPDARAAGLALLREQTREPLDLEHGPLLRSKLIRIAPDEHWLLRLSHHILYDAWSWKLYFQELEAAYESILKGFPPSSEGGASQHGGLQYGDYAVWEREVFSSQGIFRRRLAEWWKTALASQPARLDLPFRDASPARESARPSEGWLWSSLDAAVRTRLEDLARRESTTCYAIGLAAFASVLSTATGRSQVMVATHMTCRGNAALQNMQGNFARLMPLCLECPREGSFLDWLPVVRRQIVEAQAHAQIPREELWDELRTLGAEPPEIEVIFGGAGLVLPPKFGELDLTVHSHRFKGLALEVEQEQGSVMPWGFTLSFDVKNEDHQCELTFDARIYDPAKVRAFLDSYLRLLERIASAPEQPMQAASHEVSGAGR